MHKGTEDLTVYIAGPGHSGSTLLDMLLGGHEQVSALGEIHRFYLSLHKVSRPHRCDCGKPLRDCKFWQDVISELQLMTSLSEDELLDGFLTTLPEYLDIPDDDTVLAEPAVPRRYRLDLPRILAGVAPAWMYRLASHLIPGVHRYRKIARNSHLLFDAVRKVAETPVVIDSTKNPIRLRTLYLERPDQMKFIYMIRDGRAVTHSRIRRHGVNMCDAAKVWRAEHRKQSLVQRDIPEDRIYLLHYEALCSQPEAELEKLCGFLGLDFDPNLVSFRNTSRHAVGGNPMRFNQSENVILLQERWRDELTELQLDAFDEVAGDLNRSLGYR